VEFASKLIRGRKGFTLVELIVVISIISVMSVLAFPSFMQSLRRARFEKTVGEVVVLLEKARTQALASELDATQKIPPGGYGVYFDFTDVAIPVAQKAVLFVDDWNTTAGKAVKVDYADEDIVNRVMPDGIYTSGSDSEIDTVEINYLDYIRILNLKGNKLSDGTLWAHAMGNKVITIFKPPYAETTIFGDAVAVAADADLKNFEIEFKFVTEDICRQIRFNRVTTTPQIFKAACS
jgi:prepilin-type N-terminal cleavage/methylation domain-containing protein